MCLSKRAIGPAGSTNWVSSMSAASVATRTRGAPTMPDNPRRPSHAPARVAVMEDGLRELFRRHHRGPKQLIASAQILLGAWERAVSAGEKPPARLPTYYPRKSVRSPRCCRRSDAKD
jgi:hypothetical protein